MCRETDGSMNVLPQTGSFGQALKREREMRGVSLRDIAVRTKISVRFLEAIENDAWQKLPPGVFSRAFVREYARELGLDEKKVLTDMAFHVGETPEVPERVEVVRDASVRHSLVTGASFAAVISVVLILIVAPAIRRNAPPTANVVAPAVEMVPVSGSGVAEQRTEQTAVIPEPVKLTLTATEDCWIGLDMGGDRVVNQVLRKGETYSINATDDATLAVGNAGGLLIAFGSGPPVPLGARGEVKRKIPLSASSLNDLAKPDLAKPAPSPVG